MKLTLSNFPLTREGYEAYRERPELYSDGPNAWKPLDYKLRIIDYHYELMRERTKTQRLSEECDMLLQRLECLRPKRPACSCKEH